MATSKDAILRELAKVNKALDRSYDIGASSQIPGSIGTSQVNFDALLRRKRELESKLLRAGAPGFHRLRPNYLSAGTYGRDWTE